MLLPLLQLLTFAHTFDNISSLGCTISSLGCIISCSEWRGTSPHAAGAQLDALHATLYKAAAPPTCNACAPTYAFMHTMVHYDHAPE